MNTRPSPPALRPSFFHHVELQSQGARSLASLLSKALSMRVVATLRTERGTSYCLQSQQAVIVCTAPIEGRCDLISTSAASGFHTGLEWTDGVRVRAIGMNVPDAEATRQSLCRVLNDSETLTTSDDKVLNVSMPDTLGAIGLRFVESEVQPVKNMPSGMPRRMAGFSMLLDEPDTQPGAPGGIVAIDHIAVNVSEVARVGARLKHITGWTLFREFEEEVLQRPLKALTIQSPTAEGLLTIVQPTSGSSIFEHALRANGGTSVHHIALRCEDVLKFADFMFARGLWETMPAPPQQYYEDVRAMALDFLTQEEFEKLQRYGMLLDFEKDCALIQVFLPYLGDVPGVFFELIGRVFKRSAAQTMPPAPGCGGFGDRNVTELYDCLVRAVNQSPGER